MDDRDTRSKQISTVTFWHIIFPIMAIVTLLFVLYVIFRFPDEAIPVSIRSMNMRNAAANSSV